VLTVINDINTYGSRPVSTVASGEGEHVGALDLHPTLHLGREDAAKEILSIHAVCSERERIAAAATTTQLFSHEPMEPPVAVKASIQQRPQPRGSVEVRTTSDASAGCDRPTRLPDASSELPSETLELEEAISAIATEVAGAWSL
jgi:hypothetical protein